jgi:hypothetical protein
MNDQMMNYRFKLKYAYGEWIKQILENNYDGQIWMGYIITFMYNHIPGSFEHQCSVMENEIDLCLPRLSPTKDGAV